MKAATNGIETYYEIHGRKSAPWITFSHSLACSTRMWDPQIAAFKDRYRVLVYDTRGHGQSTPAPAPYSFGQLAEDVHALIKSLGIERTQFVGLSMGGMIGQTLALEHPEVLEHLVVADTGHTQTPQALEQWQERIKIAESKGMEPLVQPTLERWFTQPFRTQNPEALKKIAELIRKTPVAGYVGCAHALMKVNLTARLKDIALPVLAIAGEQDASAPGTRYIADNVRGAKLVMIAQAAHIANVEQPEAFNRALREFLSYPASARA